MEFVPLFIPFHISTVLEWFLHPRSVHSLGGPFSIWVNFVAQFDTDSSGIGFTLGSCQGGLIYLTMLGVRSQVGKNGQEIPKSVHSESVFLLLIKHGKCP